MADDGFLSGIPEVMAAFNPDAPKVEFGGGASPGGAGMAEAIACTSAYEQAKSGFQQFVQHATGGLAAYRGIAVQAAENYRQVDEQARGRYQDLGAQA